MRSPTDRTKKGGKPKEKKGQRPKREPLPMKLRALPQSFWQQPNTTSTAPPSDCAPLPLLPSVVAEDSQGSLQVTPADTDLLFSLFSTLPQEAQPGVRPKARRGRPRKSGDKCASKVKDADPYVTSVTVPEVKFQKEAMAETKALALMAYNDHQTGPPCWETTYAQRLLDLAVNL